MLVRETVAGVLRDYQATPQGRERADRIGVAEGEAVGQEREPER